ncbi:MAG: uroporphyrinogen-III C-methyltransferase [Planctomycetales bacterium]|nr:uroporphyrinogen-III C-methyltransferase [Planctomycetales bacterium]
MKGEPRRESGGRRPTRRARLGCVYLVGAGPGDPGLLTVRALDLLREADVVAHDELVSARVLDLARPGAEVVCVGHRCGAARPDHGIHPGVLAHARAGRRVVRLKGGDPFVFGRGGEEAEALAEAGIPFEVVPGVSAALGAAAYAGIPLTDRRFASGVTWLTGQEAGSRASPREGAALPAGETLVIFMASRNLSANLDRLVAGGRPPGTPAAYVASATLPDQRVVVGTLADLAARVGSPLSRSPAIVIVGEVVSLRERISWFERRPLSGRRLLVARARPGPSAVAGALRRLGADVFESPRIAVEPPTDPAPLDEALRALGRFAGTVFACATGVDAVLARLGSLDLDSTRVLPRPILAVGRGAARALRRHGIVPDSESEGACPRGLADLHGTALGARLLLVAPEDGRLGLVADLERRGASLTPVAAYRRRFRPASHPPASQLDALVLPSSTAARAILSGPKGRELAGVPAVAMGPRTEKEARRLGASRVVRTAEDTIPSLIGSVVAVLAGGPAPPRRPRDARRLRSETEAVRG